MISSTKAIRGVLWVRVLLGMFCFVGGVGVCVYNCSRARDCIDAGE